MAIREMMRADITALHQGVRNANDAISLIQTADGALGVIDEKLTRMKELAEQAATGTYTSTQRLIIDSEYQAMASEITRIANATDFNGIKLLDGSLSGATHDGSGANAQGKLKVHFGTGNDSAEDYYYIRIQEVTAAALGVGSSSNYESTVERVRTEFANAINNEFGAMATGTAEEREAYQSLVDMVDTMLAKGTDAANKIFDASKSIEEQYAAYSKLFERPTAGTGTAVTGDIKEGDFRIYGSVEELQQAALEYYRNEAANGLGGANGFAAAGANANAEALKNVAKMFDNAIIVAKDGNMLPQLTEDEFRKLSDVDRDALKTDFTMAMLNTAVNGTNAQQSSTQITNVNYDAMAGAGVGSAETQQAYSEDQLKSFISHLNYGYEAGKSKTEAINGLTEQAIGKYGDGTLAVTEFEEGTVLRASGKLQDKVVLDHASSTIAGNPLVIAAGTKLAEGTILGANTTLGSGTEIGEGTRTTSNITLTAAGTSLGKGSILVNGSTINGNTIIAKDTILTAKTAAGISLTAAQTFSEGTVIGAGSTLETGTVLGAGTTIGAGSRLDADLELRVNDTVGAGVSFTVGANPIIVTHADGTTQELTTTGGAGGTGIYQFDDAVTITSLGPAATAGTATVAAGALAGEITLGSQLTTGDAITTAGNTVLRGAGNSLAVDSVLQGTTTLGGDTTLAATNALTGFEAVLGGDTALAANSVIAGGSTFGAGTTLGEDVTFGASITLKGETTLQGDGTVLTSGTTLAKGTILAAGSTVPKGATASNESLFLGDSNISEINGVYGELQFNTTTNTIERTGVAKFGSFQKAGENMLVSVGTKVANTINMDGNNIKTQDNAQKALKAIDKAIEKKDNIRADLGALQNRLENTITNLTTQAENLQAAESRISDVDVATEMTEFTRNQVLTQSAVSMLAQANTMPQMALKLIG